ncbi:MAG: helix-turn-helix domain-containing protein [Planctomycetota bacterium]|nr:helix-turn-helix domain-containing protein [Planctomycetota bacterium]
MKSGNSERPGALPERLFTAAEVANCYGTSARTILRLARAGRIPCVRLTARLVRFRASDVAALIAEAQAHRSTLAGRHDGVSARRAAGPRRGRKRHLSEPGVMERVEGRDDAAE